MAAIICNTGYLNLAGICLALSLHTSIAFAANTNEMVSGTHVNHSHYDITGSTASELKEQMRTKGPNGWWAYTTWHINWSSDCEVMLVINYTMPHWTNAHTASKQLQDSWNKMMAALQIHEEGHGKNGINAAREIKMANCTASGEIISKWANQDKVFDKQTSHGRRKGVVLP